jgi:hypothetical protein
MTSSAILPVTIVAKACRATIDAIDIARHQAERDRLDGRSSKTRAQNEFEGSECQARCETLLSACNAARAGGAETITVSADELAAIEKLIPSC